MTSSLPTGQDGNEAPGLGLSNLTGRQLGRYLIGERLGSGGAATVYRAFDQVQGQTVALKVLLPSADEKSYTRFRREALTAGALRFPNIVRILQVGTAPHGEVAYIAMELVEGESLADLLGQRRILPPHESCALLAPIARALAHAHAAGVIHRDVKPSNILLRPARRGDPYSVQLESLDYPVTPLLSDFGIARSLDAPELTSAGRTVGTPAYMAPEQAAGSRLVDGRADIYALGTVLYRCVTGRLPFVGSATQILHAHVYEPVAIDNGVLAWLPPDLVAILQRALAKHPEDRYPTPVPMAEALERVAAAAPPPSEHDPFSTATMDAPAVPRDRSHSPSSTSILVPGVALPGAGIQGAASGAGSGNPPTVVSPYAPPLPAGRGAPPQGAAQPSRPATGSVNPRTTGHYTVQGLPPVGGQGGGTGGADEEGPLRWNNRWIWAGVVVLFFLLGGLTAGIATLLERTDEPEVAIAPTMTATSTATPTATHTPTPARAGVETPATLVIVLPPEGERTPLPTFVLPATSTPTPSPVFVQPTATPTPSATFTPTPLPTATETWTPLPSFTPTETPTETPSPAPPATDTPLPPPTAIPPTATSLPTETPTPIPPTPTPSATATPEPPTQTPTPEPIACAIPIDPALVEFVSRLDPVTRPGFDCPRGPSTSATWARLAMEQGALYDTGAGSVLVERGGWDEVDVGWQEGDPSPLPDDLQPPDGLYLPAGRFAEAWLAFGGPDRLGFATSETSESFGVVLQEFAGGLLVVNTATGEVYPFLSGNRGLSFACDSCILALPAARFPPV
jgi:serine/threonine-protein kinase